MTEYVYSLTRICLRTGELTLPGTMLDVFPDEGTVAAVDTALDREMSLRVLGPRRIGGLGPFMLNHELGVNDAIRIRPMEDGRFAFTPVPRVERASKGARELEGHLSEVVQLLETGGRPMTPSEIRAALPHLPTDLDLARRLADDPRVRLAQGRWRALDLEEALASAPATESPRAIAADDGDRAAAETEGAGAAAHATTAPAQPEATPEASAPPAGAEDALEIPYEQPDRPAADSPAAAVHAEPSADVADASDPSWPVAPRVPLGEASSVAPEPLDFGDGAVRVSRAPGVSAYPTGLSFPGARAGTSHPENDELAALGRVRDALQDLGYRTESLGGGQLMAHADLGRRSYRVLIHPLPDEQRLEWAPLLARRRDTGARYLAVFGDHRDLARLQAPADLARATLWSWTGLQRVVDLAENVLIGPVDLEPHFERDGMYEGGLARFERAVGQRIAERGAFSALLSRLSTMKAPAVFLLDDIMTDADLTRDDVLKLLERLEHAPFHLVSRVGSGEFCLRYGVSDALLHLSQYALSLRDQLPNRKRERVIGTAVDEAAVASEAGGTPAETAVVSSASDTADAEAVAVPVPAGRSGSEHD